MVGVVGDPAGSNTSPPLRNRALLALALALSPTFCTDPFMPQAIPKTKILKDEEPAPPLPR